MTDTPISILALRSSLESIENLATVGARTAVGRDDRENFARIAEKAAQCRLIVGPSPAVRLHPAPYVKAMSDTGVE